MSTHIDGTLLLASKKIGHIKIYVLCHIKMCYQFYFICFAGLNCLSDERKLIENLPALIATETSIKALTFLKSQEPQKICPISPVGRSRPGSMFSPLSKRDKRHLASSPLCRPHVCQIFALHCVDTCRYLAYML